MTAAAVLLGVALVLFLLEVREPVPIEPEKFRGRKPGDASLTDPDLAQIASWAGEVEVAARQAKALVDRAVAEANKLIEADLSANGRSANRDSYIIGWTYAANALMMNKFWEAAHVVAASVWARVPEAERNGTEVYVQGQALLGMGNFEEALAWISAADEMDRQRGFTGPARQMMDRIRDSASDALLRLAGDHKPAGAANTWWVDELEGKLTRYNDGQTLAHELEVLLVRALRAIQADLPDSSAATSRYRTAVLRDLACAVEMTIRWAGTNNTPQVPRPSFPDLAHQMIGASPWGGYAVFNRPNKDWRAVFTKVETTGTASPETVLARRLSDISGHGFPDATGPTALGTNDQHTVRCFWRAILIRNYTSHFIEPLAMLAGQSFTDLVKDLVHCIWHCVRAF